MQTFQALVYVDLEENWKKILRIVSFLSYCKYPHEMKRRIEEVNLNDSNHSPLENTFSSITRVFQIIRSPNDFSSPPFHGLVAFLFLFLPSHPPSLSLSFFLSLFLSFLTNNYWIHRIFQALRIYHLNFTDTVPALMELSLVRRSGKKLKLTQSVI